MQGIFDPRWVYHHRKTVDTAALGYIRISRPDGTKSDWDPETGDVTSPGLYVLYEGKARWQKKGQPTKRDHLQDTANFQRVLVQVSFKEFADWQAENPLPGVDTHIRPNDRIELIINEANPDSDGSTVYVWGDATSSNPWHHTFMCQENMKQS